MAEDELRQGFLDLFTRQDEQNILMLGKLDALLYWLRNDLPPLMMGELPTTLKNYITEKSGGFADGVLGVGSVVRQVLIETTLQRNALNGYIHCQAGTITVRLNDGDPIYLTAGLTVNLSTHRPHFEVDVVQVEGEAAGSQFRMVLW